MSGPDPTRGHEIVRRGGKAPCNRRSKTSRRFPTAPCGGTPPTAHRGCPTPRVPRSRPSRTYPARTRTPRASRTPKRSTRASAGPRTAPRPGSPYSGRRPIATPRRWTRRGGGGRNILSNFHEYTGDDEADEDVWFGTIKKDIMRANEDFCEDARQPAGPRGGSMYSDPESCDKYVADALAGRPGGRRRGGRHQGLPRVRAAPERGPQAHADVGLRGGRLRLRVPATGRSPSTHHSR